MLILLPCQHDTKTNEYLCRGSTVITPFENVTSHQSHSRTRRHVLWELRALETILLLCDDNAKSCLANQSKKGLTLSLEQWIMGVSWDSSCYHFEYIWFMHSWKLIFGIYYGIRFNSVVFPNFLFEIEIPVLPTIVGRVTFQRFDADMSIPESKFFIPRNYKVILCKTSKVQYFTNLRFSVKYFLIYCFSICQMFIL